MRMNLWRLGPEWSMVVNPRQAASVAPFEDLKREVEKLFWRCGRQ